MAKKQRARYTAAERRAYYIGRGVSMAQKDDAGRRAFEKFSRKCSDKEFRSYQNGLMSVVYEKKGE